MIASQLKIEWGLQPPADAIAAWGARALFTQSGRIDIIWDRCSFDGPEDEVHQLIDWIEDIGMDDLRDMAENLPWDSHHVIRVYGGKEFEMNATPKASYGYLFIGAWKKPATESTPHAESAGEKEKI